MKHPRPRGWKTIRGRTLIAWDGRAFDILDLNTRDRELVPLPDPPPVKRPRPRK